MISGFGHFHPTACVHVCQCVFVCACVYAIKKKHGTALTNLWVEETYNHLVLRWWHCLWLHCWQLLSRKAVILAFCMRVNYQNTCYSNISRTFWPEFVCVSVCMRVFLCVCALGSAAFSVCVPVCTYVILKSAVNPVAFHPPPHPECICILYTAELVTCCAIED